MTESLRHKACKNKGKHGKKHFANIFSVGNVCYARQQDVTDLLYLLILSKYLVLELMSNQSNEKNPLVLCFIEIL